MKMFKRDESFRFTFPTPYPGKFRVLIEKEGKTVTTKEGTLEVLDLSPKGLKFKTPYSLPVDRQDFFLEIFLEMNNVEIKMTGHPIWKKEIGKSLIYGFSSKEDETTEQAIIEILKIYTKEYKKKQ